MTWIAAGIALFLLWKFVDKTIERGKARSRAEKSERRESSRGKASGTKRPPRHLRDPGMTPYDVLGVTPRMTDEQIATAYKKLVVKNHPDKMGDRSPEERQEAASRLREINEAYAALKDRPEPRA
jgi:DnaJ-class molecular chaperone